MAGSISGWIKVDGIGSDRRGSNVSKSVVTGLRSAYNWLSVSLTD